MNFKEIKCPKCGKKGLHYAAHPHAYGWKNYDVVKCRYCDARFKAEEIELLATKTDAIRAAAAHKGS